MRRLLLLPLLAACAPAGSRPPELVPLGGLLAASDALAAIPSPAPGLSAEAADLAGRAGAVPLPGGSVDAARLAALAARAEALRAPVLSEEERARLDGDPAPSLQ